MSEKMVVRSVDLVLENGDIEFIGRMLDDMGGLLAARGDENYKHGMIYESLACVRDGMKCAAIAAAIRSHIASVGRF